MNWHTETPPRLKHFPLFAQIWHPGKKEGYVMGVIYWCPNTYNVDTDKYEDCWVSQYGWCVKPEEIFVWTPMKFIEDECNKIRNVDIEVLIKQRNF